MLDKKTLNITMAGFHFEDCSITNTTITCSLRDFSFMQWIDVLVFNFAIMLLSIFVTVVMMVLCAAFAAACVMAFFALLAFLVSASNWSIDVFRTKFCTREQPTEPVDVEVDKIDNYNMDQ